MSAINYKQDLYKQDLYKFLHKTFKDNKKDVANVLMKKITSYADDENDWCKAFIGGQNTEKCLKNIKSERYGYTCANYCMSICSKWIIPLINLTMESLGSNVYLSTRYNLNLVRDEEDMVVYKEAKNVPINLSAANLTVYNINDKQLLHFEIKATKIIIPMPDGELVEFSLDEVEDFICTTLYDLLLQSKAIKISFAFLFPRIIFNKSFDKFTEFIQLTFPYGQVVQLERGLPSRNEMVLYSTDKLFTI